MGGEVRAPLKKNEQGFGTPTIVGRIHFDEKYVNVQGEWEYDLNGIDSKTKFILSELLVEERNLAACKAFLKVIKTWCYAQIMACYERERLKPVKERRLIALVCDGFGNYKTAAKRLFRRIAKITTGVPIACKKYGLKHNNNHAERLNREIERRIVVLGAFQSHEGAQATLALRKLVHNYVMPHTELGGKTPAEAAKMHLNLGENKLLGLIRLAKKD